MPVTLPLGGGLRGLLGGLRTPLRLTEGVRLDFERCITAGLLGRPPPPPLPPTTERLPVEVADFNRWTSGFSTGLGILDSQGMSGEGGWCLGVGVGGPAMIPSATCLMSRLHLSHRLRLTGGLSSSGVVKGLPPRALAPWSVVVTGRIIAEVETLLQATLLWTAVDLHAGFFASSVLIPTDFVTGLGGGGAGC